MRNGNKKLFLSKPLLYRMVNLRINGYSFTSLAILFSCHRSSVESQCDRYRITPWGPVYTIERIASDVLSKMVAPEPRWEIVDGERYSLGKSYAEYLKEDAARRRNIRIV